MEAPNFNGTKQPYSFAIQPPRHRHGTAALHKTIYNRFIRWSRLGLFNCIFVELAGQAGEADRIMIDATHIKAHRTAASFLKGGFFPDVSGAPRAA
jgi:hypothetical protein